MKGFVDLQIQEYHTKADHETLAKQVFGHYTEKQIPTLVNLVHEFTTFNYWHSDVPGVGLPSAICFYYVS